PLWVTREPAGHHAPSPGDAAPRRVALYAPRTRRQRPSLSSSGDTVIGDRKAGEYPAIDLGGLAEERRGHGERRKGKSRRRENAHVSVERRIGFDRRALRDRRSGARTSDGAQLGLSLPAGAGPQDARTAALTGLFSRRYLETGLRRELERCRRYGAKTSLLMFDLDRFKEANDRYGHLAGDLALKTLGELIGRHLRAIDIPCRYGGDE